METVGPPPADAELHLVPDLNALTGASGRERQRTAGIVSILAHAVLIGVLATVPHEYVPTQPEPSMTRRITPLIEPPSVLTQKAPSPSKTSKELQAVVTPPPRKVAGPSTAPPAPAPVRKAPLPAPAAPTPAPVAVAPPPMPEAPKVEPAKEPPKPDILQLPPAAPPQIQAEEQPRNPFERPGGPLRQVLPSERQIPLPDPGQAIRGGAPGGAAGSQGMSPGSLQSGPGATLELPALLSDAQGVDFRPYLIRLLATVKRNWMTVWPDSARSGRRGRVGVQFAIAKEGNVTKVVFAFQSGADALDRAAVAAISMSNPFPPLPTEFKGDRIVLQFDFAYNMAK